MKNSPFDLRLVAYSSYSRLLKDIDKYINCEKWNSHKIIMLFWNPHIGINNLLVPSLCGL